jgi:hypothetical protein
MTANNNNNKEIAYKQNFEVTKECETCGRQHKNKDIIHITHFTDDKLQDECYPEPEDWKCPEHPDGPHYFSFTETLKEVEELR